MNVVTLKTKYSLWPVIKNTDNPVNQLKLDANTWSQCKNVCKRVISNINISSAVS